MFQKLIANGHFLYHDDGKPFFYLADTAWEMIHRLNLEETKIFLADRASKGFTAIQTVLISELNGLTEPNANGDLPFKNGKPVEAYFRHVDAVLDEAEKLGLFFALLPSWGCYWQEENPNRILMPENAADYGRFLGKRYHDRNIIWVLGGDRIPQAESDYATIRALAKGIREGDKGRHLMTFHPIGPADSSEFLHNEEWLDFNMCQSSHAARDHFNGAFIRRDWSLQPVKPVLDGEPRYERIIVGFYNQGANPADCFDDFDTRQAAYFAVFSGACGHTYGNNNIWQMYDSSRKSVLGANIPWYEAIHHPGARQVGYLRKLMEENDFTHLEDASDRLFDAPAVGGERVLARISSDYKQMLVYSPYGKRFGADCTWAKGCPLKQSWFNCAYGVTTHLHTSATGSLQTFIPPTEGRGCDWVLILEAE